MIRLRAKTLHHEADHSHTGTVRELGLDMVDDVATGGGAGHDVAAAGVDVHDLHFRTQVLPDHCAIFSGQIILFGIAPINVGEIPAMNVGSFLFGFPSQN